MNRDTQTGKDLLSRKNVDLPLKRWEKKAGQFAVTLKEIIQRFLRSKGFVIQPMRSTHRDSQKKA